MRFIQPYDEPHEHQWGGIETSRMSGTVHRKCKVVGCNIINLDFDDEDSDDSLGPCGCSDYHYADCHLTGGQSYGDMTREDMQAEYDEEWYR